MTKKVKVTDMTKDQLIKEARKLYRRVNELQHAGVKKAFSCMDDEKARNRWLMSEEYEKTAINAINVSIRLALLEKQAIKKGWIIELTNARTETLVEIMNETWNDVF